MRRGIFTLTLFASAAFAGNISQASEQLADHLIRGQYQAIIGDCTACHSKKGGKPFAGGEPLQTPFGALVPPNITPDRETGIGNWSEADFRNALKKGVGHGGKRLYPAMPYPAYTKMPDSDISDLWAYMRTIEPVHNPVEANQLPFPLNVRLLMAGWNGINFSAEPFKPDPDQSEEWNRGAYLVQGPGHCGTCHSPKTVLGADKTDEALQGASLQGWYAPAITGNVANGIGGWSKDEIVRYLKTGSNGRTIASGPMSEAIEHSTSKMDEADLKAIAVYLKTVPPLDDPEPKPVSADDPQFKIGAAIYHDTCSACHGMDGKGAGQLFPALADNAIVRQPSIETLARLVLAGSQGVQTKAMKTTPAMPSLAWRLDDEQIAAVLTYVRNSWNNAAPPASASDVASVRQSLTDR
ncbi:c-type cytochrome [Mesorhizobium sp. NPDC059054]|uniref:c-type cytochrome n=1 Tax=Mesorhizobium sp. NPDC059054 TaxID=3346711 RepID=UPI003674263B